MIEILFLLKLLENFNQGINNKDFWKKLNELLKSSNENYNQLDTKELVKLLYFTSITKVEDREYNNIGDLMNGVKSLNNIQFSPNDLVLAVIIRCAYIDAMANNENLDINKINENSIQSNFKLIKESSENNYGHENLILQGSVNFPKKEEYLNNQNKKSYNKYGGSDSYNQDYYNYNQDYNYSNQYENNNEPIFDKQKEISNNVIEPVSNQKDFFELYRYGISSTDKLLKPSDNIAPTLCLSLFMPNEKIYTRNFKDWMYKYFLNQLRIILLFKFYFPDANIRNYLDYYMLEEGFAKISGNDDSLKINKYFDKFDCNDFEETRLNERISYLADFYKKIKQVENYNFSSGLERFIYYLELASKSINYNGKVIITDRPGDFFVYKLAGPFIENVNGNIGHITNGYIGQEMRYISVKQKKYNWNGTNIRNPVHLVWRDAHSCTPGQNDYEWINKCFEIGNKLKNNYFLIPTSTEYAPGWNDKVKCDVSDYYVTRSAIAGIVQFMNFTEDEQMIPDEIYKLSVGMTFLLDENKELPIKYHRPYFKPYYEETIRSEYSYGIDEYINSSFFVLDYYRKRSLYYNFNWYWRIFDNWGFDSNILTVAEILLLVYLVKNNIFKMDQSITRNDFIKEVEKLRNDKNLSSNDALRFILSISPTKYHYNLTTFNFGSFDLEKYIIPTFEIKSVITNFKSNIDESKKKYYDDLSIENLQGLGLNCKNAVLQTSVEWCINPYLYSKEDKEIKCSPANYYSGFYFDEPPSLNIGILRSPMDMDKAITILNNPYKLKLNKSDYKLTNDLEKWGVNVDDKNTGHIISKLQNLILNYNDKQDYIQQRCVDINGQETNTYSVIFVPLIWKALLNAGYDVPSSWIKYNKKLDEKSQRDFNELVIELSEIDGWAEYATYILLNNEIKKVNFNNNFEDIKLIEESNRIKEITKNEKENIEKNKMDKYKLKYLKYKSKYLKLLK